MSNFFSLPISVTTQQAPANYVPPQDMQGLLEALPKFTDMEMTDTGANITMNANAAGADLNGLWVWRLDQYKLPPRLMTGYRGGWWQLYTGLATEIRMFMGYPAGYFDASGRGKEYSGWEGWQLCNGQNGALNLENFFIIPGYRNDGTSWVASVYWSGSGATVNADGTINWGDATQDFIDINPNERQFTISLNNFPLFSLWVNWSQNFKLTKSGSGDNWGTPAPGANNGSFNTSTWVYQFDQHAIMLSYPMSRLPPYVAVAYVQFIGYQ
jgi:hypothetical protein